MTLPKDISAPKFENFGCRLNAYETQAMSELAEAAGLSDILVVNSCAVTSEAVRQARQRIRALKRENPDARLVVTGCAAQTEVETFEAMEEVDFVIGNIEKMQPETWRMLKANQAPKTQIQDIMAVKRPKAHRIDGLLGRARAYVQVQNGCDHRCTFCIIPYGRGNSRSVPAPDAVEMIKRLRDQGFNEVVLTGVDMTSWGADLEGAPRLGQLVERILRDIPDLPRLRISSIDSIEADPALIDAITSEKRLMPHLHLSLQSGDNLILKRMKRRHSREDAISFCQSMLKARPEMVYGADIIAGFPTETDAHFENSLRLIDECGLTWLHVFPYSPRHGTPAARMPQLPKSIIKERASDLRQKGEERVRNYHQSLHGSRQSVLIEGRNKGRLEGYAEVHLTQEMAEEAMVGALVDCHIFCDENGKLFAKS